ncbi:MAG TPA: aldehyde dehydrogenase family protein, partial [Trueperaceae bacterium]
MSNHDWFGGQYLGRERSRAGHTTFHATNPQNGERLPGAFVEATKIEIADAGQRAQEAFEQLNDVAPANTAAFLLAVAAALEDDNQAIIARADAETGLGRPRLEGELGRTTGQLRMFADLARDGSWVDARIDRTAGPDLRRMRIPLGPVAVFGASNFPLAFSVAGGDSASAWAAGCPVIVK